MKRTDRQRRTPRRGRPDIHEIAKRAPVVERLEDLAAPGLFKGPEDFERFRRALEEVRRGPD